MSSLVTDLVQDVRDRLILGASTQEPTDAMITTWVLSAFKSLIGTLPPVHEVVATVDADRQAAVTADQVFYVANGPHLLFASEWNKQNSMLIFQPSSVKDADVITAWCFLDPDITSDSTTVNTTCIFGTDWLESLAVLHAASRAMGRMANIAGEGDAAGYASWARVLDEEFKEMFTLYQNRWQGWNADMQQRIVDRARFGEAPPKQAPRANFVNKSQVIPNLLAQGDTSS